MNSATQNPPSGAPAAAKTGQRGFTLVEAAVAIGVVAILSGIMIPLVLKSINDAKLARARNDLQVIAGALAHQIKDTGRRPLYAGGPGGATAVGQAVWYSGGAGPAVAAPQNHANNANGQGLQVINIPAPPAANQPDLRVNTFLNLLSTPHGAATIAQGNVLFGYNAATPANAEFGYKGPYLGGDQAVKSDPWGGAYLILGYNAIGQAANGPVWIVSAGPDRSINPANLTVGNDNKYPAVWDYTGASANNLAVRIQ